MKIVAFIPAHLASVRLKEKILLKIHGLEMIEHVRRRALLSGVFDRVIVATGDEEIATIVESYDGEVIRTKNDHISGTSRVAEAVKKIEASHIVIIQGDEPLMLPKHLEALVIAIKKRPNVDSWNATSKLLDNEDLNKHSFVKCALGNREKILYCFRRAPSFLENINDLKYIRKILGLIAFKREVLLSLCEKEKTDLEISESIEQLKTIYYGYEIFSVNVEPTLPSVNEPGDCEKVMNYLSNNPNQLKLLNDVINF